jgi:hypothetical protein
MTANGTAPVVSMRHDATDGDDDACFPRRSNEQATVRNQEARWSRCPNLEPLNALMGTMEHRRDASRVSLCGWCPGAPRSNGFKAGTS